MLTSNQAFVTIASHARRHPPIATPRNRKDWQPWSADGVTHARQANLPVVCHLPPIDQEQKRARRGMRVEE